MINQLQLGIHDKGGIAVNWKVKDSLKTVHL